MRHHRFSLACACWLMLSVCCIAQSSNLSSESGLISPITHTPPSSVSPKAHPVAQNFEQFAVYWTDEAGWHSELQLKNNLVGRDLTVSPALRMADGSELALRPVTIKSASVVALDLHEAALMADPKHARGFGSVVLRYNATVFHALYAAVMVHDSGHPIAFHMDAYPQPKKFTTGSREGIWWLPNSAATDYLILSNTGDSSLNGTVVIYDSAGLPFRQTMSLAARQTQRLSVRSLLQRAGLRGSYGGIEIDVSGRAGYLQSAHVVFDEAAGFGAIMKMFQHHPGAKLEERTWGRVKQWTTRAPMLALVNPDPALAFPTGTQLEPKVFVRNTSSKTYTADLRFNWYSGSSSGKTSTIPIPLKAHETRIIDVTSLQSQKIIPLEAQWSSVILSAPIKPDELMAVAASYDKSLRYGAQTPFNDQLSAHWEGGKWEVDGTHNSIVTAGNGSDRPIRAQVTLFFNGGQDKYQIEQELAPDEQLWLDLGKLIRSQSPDAYGNVLPAGLTSGTYQFRDLTDRAVGNIFEGKVITDKTYGHAAYGCMICCGYPYGGFMWTDPLSVGAGFSIPQDVGATNACSGGADPIGFWYPNWGTVSPSIATVSSPQQINGIAAGSTWDWAANGQINVGDGMTYVEQCPTQSDYPPDGAVTTYTQVQHNYPRIPFAQVCRIAQFFDRIGHAGTSHKAEDVVFDGGSTTWGTPVYAMEAGTVSKVVSNAGPASVGFPQCQGLGYPGNRVNVQTSDGYTTVYYHVMPSPGITVGTQVTQGQQIGTLDGSGCQSGPHLHVGRIGPNGPVNFTIPCVNPLPGNNFGDGIVDDDDTDIP